MDRFIQDQNVRRYRQLLERVTDEIQRQMLLNLLASEEAKHAGRWLPKER